jgi:hypothetical protein
MQDSKQNIKHKQVNPDFYETRLHYSLEKISNKEITNPD